jgi:GNAT superfamily N-acetyltransferase
MEHWCSTDLVATDLALFVEAEFRGSMLAARLIVAYLRWARDIGAKLITAGVSTGVHVEQTAQLYERLGMRRLGVLLEA